MGVGLLLIAIGVIFEILVIAFLYVEEKVEKGGMKKLCRIDFSKMMTSYAIVGIMFIFAGLLAVFITLIS